MKRTITLTGAVVALLVAAAAAAATQGIFAQARRAPDLILINGNVATVDADNSFAEAVAIQDGEILAVGRNAGTGPPGHTYYRFWTGGRWSPG